jgi:hypothetical protein
MAKDIVTKEEIKINCYCPQTLKKTRPHLSVIKRETRRIAENM